MENNTMVTTNKQQLALYNIATMQSQQIRSILPGLVFRAAYTPNGVVLRTTRDSIRPLAAFLRNSTGLQSSVLTDIAATDKLDQVGRFSIKYNFLSVVYNRRLTVELFSEETLSIPSLAAPFLNNQKIFASAGWLEREVWDLFGAYFSEHGDLRRILTDYGFTGHPLRKDFPLTGFHELVYNDAEGRVTSEPVELAQEFRVFHIAAAKIFNAILDMRVHAYGIIVSQK
jgi:NADH:ubiquinone oxidoreductase subunit C